MAENIELIELRSRIDEIDKRIIKCLKDRLDISKKIGLLKKEWGMEIVDPRRWANVVANRLEMAKELDMDEDLVLEIYDLIQQQSIRIQEQV